MLRVVLLLCVLVSSASAELQDRNQPANKPTGGFGPKYVPIPPKPKAVEPAPAPPAVTTDDGLPRLRPRARRSRTDLSFWADREQLEAKAKASAAAVEKEVAENKARQDLANLHNAAAYQEWVKQQAARDAVIQQQINYYQARRNYIDDQVEINTRTIDALTRPYYDEGGALHLRGRLQERFSRPAFYRDGY